MHDGSHDGKTASHLRRRLILTAAFVSAAPFFTTAQAQEAKRFDLALKGGALPKEQQTVRVKQGDQIELRWTSDQPLRLHLHGYDIQIDVKPGEPAVTALKARTAGRFSVEKLQQQKSGHQHGGKVLYLEVYP
jgi:hypothetical protein